MKLFSHIADAFCMIAMVVGMIQDNWFAVAALVVASFGWKIVGDQCAAMEAHNEKVREMFVENPNDNS